MAKGPSGKRRRGATTGRKNGESESDKDTSVKRSKLQEDNSRNAVQHPSSSLLIHFSEKESTWYELASDHPDRNLVFNSEIERPKDLNIEALAAEFRSTGEEIFRKEIQLSRQKQKQKDDRWVESTMKKGTLKDRIAAMSVVISSNPIHEFLVLDGLLSMAGCTGDNTYQKTNSRVAQMAAESLEDLFLNTFLPGHRKLLTLEDRPLHLFTKAPRNLSPRILLLWRFEEVVKERFLRFLQTYMKHTLQDEMEVHKVIALRSAAQMLRTVPEGESLLLQLIVNKLGDPEKKVAAAAGHELRKVLKKHPAMLVVIAREVQQLVHRPHLSKRALYNCITFLNQLKLSMDIQAGKTTLPASLVSTYFRLFEVAVKKQAASGRKSKGEEAEDGMKSRLLSALLTGIHRAQPFLPDNDKDLESHIDGLYKVVHVANPSAATQALLILYHVVIGDRYQRDSKVSTESTVRRDRFHRALYSKISETSMVGSGKHVTMFFNLLYKSLKYDSDAARVQVFAKRLLSTTIHCGPHVAAASLYLLNEITKYHPSLLSSWEEVPVGEMIHAYLDPSKREPKGAIATTIAKEDGNPDSVPLWEMNLCLHHFHPTIQKFCQNFGSIDYSGDPLLDFSLPPFLDRFAYRNPKKMGLSSTKAPSSVAKRRSGIESLAKKVNALPINDPRFLSESEVDDHEEFFHRFFVEQARRDELKGITRHKPRETSDDEGIEKAEQDALDEAEANELGNSTFDYQWETDSEEEAFVDSLAAKIMEDAHGPVDIDDDEDFDTEDWGDIYDGSEEELEKSGLAALRDDDSDKDAVSEESSDSSESSGEEEDKLLREMASDGDEDLHAMEHHDSSASSGEDSDSEALAALPTFAPLEEYEDRINQSWSKRLAH